MGLNHHQRQQAATATVFIPKGLFYTAAGRNIEFDAFCRMPGAGANFGQLLLAMTSVDGLLLQDPAVRGTGVPDAAMTEVTSTDTDWLCSEWALVRGHARALVQIWHTDDGTMMAVRSYCFGWCDQQAPSAGES